MNGATLGTVQHDERSEFPQPPQDSEWWQESAFVTWYDHDADIGGIIRIGHEPNHNGGQTALWFGLVTHNGQRYRRNVTSRLTTGDRPADGLGALDGRYRLTYDGVLRFLVDDDDCKVDLQIVDFYPRTHFFAATGSLTEDFASNHFESSGQITGTVQLADTVYDVDGLCHRDRSWGIRHWNTLLNSRWVPGTFGPDLSFGSITWHTVDGAIGQHGYVVRHGEVTLATDVDVVVMMEADGTTFRGGTATWTLPGEEPFTIECALVDGILSQHHGVAVVDAPGQVHHGGRRGFCHLEVSTNPRAGTRPVTEALRAVSTDGLSHRPPA